MPSALQTSPEKCAAIVVDRKNGLTRSRIAAKYKISESTVDRILAKEQLKSVNAPAPPPLDLPPTAPLVASVPPETQLPAQSHRGNAKFKHLAGQIVALHAQGYSPKEIAEKLGMVASTGNLAASAAKYYIDRRDKIKMSEGVSSNGHEQLDTRFLVGFGCAELERTLAAIAQRLGISPNLLRQGFSKFLGSAPLR